MLLAGLSSSAAADERPNVLWIYLEDVSGWFSCYGDEVIQTPHIDALAKSGTRFDRFYTCAGVCSAMRSGTITGMIKAFMVIEQAGGKVDAQALAGGIWEAMVTTGMGLAVALPILFLLHWLEGLAARRTNTMHQYRSPHRLIRGRFRINAKKFAIPCL